MTTPETPASVLGGPDLLTEMAARLRHRVDECGVEMTCMFDEDGCHGCTACEQDEALLDRYDREHTRPTTARDAALREEGRVQERARAVEWHRECAKACRDKAMKAYDKRSDVVRRLWNEQANAHEINASAMERGDHLKPQPDASQGSAPVADDDEPAKPWMCACPRAAAIQRLGPDGRTAPTAPWTCIVCLLPVTSGAPPAAPQGSPLRGGERRKDGRPRVGGDEWKLLNRTAERDALQEQVDKLLDEKEAVRNPPDGGALEGERGKLLEKLVAAQDKLLVAYRLGASRSPGKAIDDIRRLKEKLAAMAPAIPQSGDEKEGTG